MKKTIKEKLKENQIKGKIGEQLSKKNWEIKNLGFSPKRDPKGQDFTSTEMNWMTGKVRKVHIESKVNNSRLSKLQKSTRDKVIKRGDRYQIDKWKVNL
ncbi:MAG TPA: hypothetical protein PK357_00350 [Candidatus Pacearchaeota archaeon]|nr:hypothetical protein [Candidatus Pacearchaeota archaeon]